MALLTPSVDVRRSGDRFATDIGWLDSKHSFSFGHHYDARNTHFGLLLVNNDDVVSPGSGFETVQVLMRPGAHDVFSVVLVAPGQ